MDRRWKRRRSVQETHHLSYRLSLPGIIMGTKIQIQRKTLRDFLDLLIDDFQATPEERAAVKALIEQAWDPNEHIVKLFLRLKKQLTILGEMKYVIPYPEEDFIEALYMAVQKTK